MTARGKAATPPNPAPSSAPSALQAALGGLCPRCGSKTLFDDLVNFAPACPKCGLDFSSFHVSIRLAAFLMMITVAIIITLAIFLDTLFRPPLWLQALLWVPLTAASVVFSLRLAKAALIIAKYRKAVRTGRIVADDTPDDS